MKNLFSIILLALAMACQEAAVPAEGNISGEWLVREVFLGDVIDTPCGFEVPDAPQLTIFFSDEKNNAGAFSFEGQAAINSFFGTYEVMTFNETTGQGTVELESIGSTKMGGPEELMACESRFFEILRRTTDFSITSENGKDVLRIGAFKKGDEPSRDGGTFLIMERL